MYFNKASGSYEIIGTLAGGGYSCVRNKVHFFEGSQNGIWNKVSSWIGWIKEEMNRYQEEQCQIGEIRPPLLHKSQTPQTTSAPTSASTTLTTTTSVAVTTTTTDYIVEKSIKSAANFVKDTEPVKEESEETELERKIRMRNILLNLG